MIPKLSRSHRRVSPACLVSVLLSLLFLVSIQIIASEKPYFKGFIGIPVSLVTPEGTLLEKGKYELEVKPEDEHYVLTFFSGGQIKAVIRPLPDPASSLSSAHIPLIGTQFLHSSAEPVLTGEQRRSSKTGAAQYEEENRDWKATLRLYKSSADGAAYFLFEVRGEQDRWYREAFKLGLK